jgi:hypothetical protein
MKFLRYISLILICLSYFSCHKKKHDPDPCASLHKVTANFYIYEDFQAWAISSWKTYDTDTVFTSEVQFTATEDNATYKWIIGGGTYTQKSFELDFTGAPLGTIIPITLIVTKTPDKACFPNDDGVDTLTRSMYLANAYSQSMIKQGKYHGYWEENPLDTFTIDIEMKYDTISSLNELYLIGMNKSSTCGTFCYSNIGYKEILFASKGAYCSYPVGSIFSTGNGKSIRIEYNLENKNTNPYSYINHTFIGTKVP